MVEPDALRVVRDAYDTVAPEYARLFQDELSRRPLDRAMLGVFAEAVRQGGDGGADGNGDGRGGQVADLGCGPGHITAHLRELGLSVFGVDTSSVMVELARGTHPGLRFEVGSMGALDIADGALAGVLSRWSIIHTPPREVPGVLAEFHRVLAPGGHLLIGFWGADDPSRPTEAFDHAVTEAHRWSPDHLALLLREVGLDEVARMTREPQPADRRQFQEIHLLARKAPAEG